jgi:hypothetical protein
MRGLRMSYDDDDDDDKYEEEVQKGVQEAYRLYDPSNP